jgi:hypothetical protein
MHMEIQCKHKNYDEEFKVYIVIVNFSWSQLDKDKKT